MSTPYENAALANRALLVSLGISQWDARRIDKAETDAVQTKHNAKKKSVRVHKSLLPGCFELEAVHKYTGEMRTFVYKHTLPWAEGVQILRTTGYLDFTQKIGMMRSHWEGLVQNFISAYPHAVSNAQWSLGTLFDANDYPDVNDLAAKFTIDVKYLPVPESNDWRVELGNEHLDALRKSVEEQLKASQAAAMKEAWSRLYKVVEHAHERLANPKAVFRDSLVDNAIEVCELLPSLNIANDPELESMRQTIESALCTHDPRTLRRSTTARTKAATDLRKAMDKMSSYTGVTYA
jgi:hypothetical protein